uniref:Uncharacterized protein n=1 Tax=Globodera rostochiensis TaxID=31243 RepID=A0A914H913_GLORO
MSSSSTSTSTSSTRASTFNKPSSSIYAANLLRKNLQILHFWTYNYIDKHEHFDQYQHQFHLNNFNRFNYQKDFTFKLFHDSVDGGAWPFLVRGAICLVCDALRCPGQHARYTSKISVLVLPRKGLVNQ